MEEEELQEVSCKEGEEKEEEEEEWAEEELEHAEPERGSLGKGGNRGGEGKKMWASRWGKVKGVEEKRWRWRVEESGGAFIRKGGREEEGRGGSRGMKR